MNHKARNFLRQNITLSPQKKRIRPTKLKTYMFFFFAIQISKNKKKELPRREVVDVADKHLKLASTFRSETGVHLNRHRIRHLSQLPYRRRAILLEHLQDLYHAPPFPAAFHPPPHHVHRRRAHRRSANNRRTNSHFTHLSLGESQKERKKKKDSF